MPRPFVTMLHPPLPMLHPLVAMLHPFLPMRRPFVAVLYAFAATRCEREDALHEESHDHHALHGVPDPSLERRSECVGSSSERATTRPAYVGIPREPQKTPSARRARSGLRAARGFSSLPSVDSKKERIAKGARARIAYLWEVVRVRTFVAMTVLVAAAGLLTGVSACHSPASTDGVTDLDGRSFDPFAGDAKATVLVFVATDCPLSNRYAPELRRLFERYGPRGVAFRLVYPTVEESREAVREHVREYGFPFAAVRDPSHTLVARAKAAVTPESAVFARGGRLVYHGRIDDRQVDFGQARPEPTRRDLQDAIDAVLEGRAPDETEAPSIGCAIPNRT
jgi:hypothetical protein